MGKKSDSRNEKQVKWEPGWGALPRLQPLIYELVFSHGMRVRKSLSIWLLVPRRLIGTSETKQTSEIEL